MIECGCNFHQRRNRFTLYDTKEDTILYAKTKQFWKKYRRKDPAILALAIRESGFDTKADEYFEIQFQYWEDLPVEAQKGLVEFWKKLGISPLTWAKTWHKLGSFKPT